MRQHRLPGRRGATEPTGRDPRGQHRLLATTDTSGHVLYANSAFRERFGVGSIEEVASKSPSLFDFFSAESREQFLRDGVPDLWTTGRWAGEIEGIDADGVAVPISQSAIAHRDPDGQARYFSGIGRDISETKATQTALFESHQRFHALVALGNDRDLRHHGERPDHLRQPGHRADHRIQRRGIGGTRSSDLILRTTSRLPLPSSPTP